MAAVERRDRRGRRAAPPRRSTEASTVPSGRSRYSLDESATGASRRHGPARREIPITKSARKRNSASGSSRGPMKCAASAITSSGTTSRPGASVKESLYSARERDHPDRRAQRAARRRLRAPWFAPLFGEESPRFATRCRRLRSARARGRGSAPVRHGRRSHTSSSASRITSERVPFRWAAICRSFVSSSSLILIVVRFMGMPAYHCASASRIGR